MTRPVGTMVPGTAPVPGPPGRRLGRVAGTLTGHGAAPLLALVTPLLAVPAVVHAAGATGWTSIAVGQSVGALAAIVVSMSWPLTGPATVAAAPAADRADLYHRSLLPQLLVFTGCAPTAALVAVLVTPGHELAGALTAVAFAAQGLSASWFNIGTNAPWTTVRNEALTRFVATGAAAGLLFAGAALWLYPALLLAAAAAGHLLNLRTVRARHGVRALGGLGPATRELRAQRAGTVARCVNAVYWTGGVTVVTALATVGAPVFAAADRVQKSALNALLALPQALIAWVGRGGAPVDTVRRYRVALLADAVLSGLAGIALWLAWPLVTELLFRGAIPAVADVRLVSAAIVACTLLERSIVMHWLVPMGLERTYYRLGNVASVLALVVLAAVVGLATASAGLLVVLAVEATLAAVFLAAGGRELRRLRGAVA